MHLIVLRLRHADRGTIVVVNAHGVVGNVGYLGREGCKGVRVRFCGEESVDIQGAAQKSRFIVVEAGDQCVWAQRQR